MSKNEEIEVKLQINNSKDLRYLSHFISELYRPGPPKFFHMSACYYDTENAFLQKNHIVYRVRKENNTYIATIKGKNQSSDFLARRLEINRQVGSICPNLKIFDDIENIRDKINLIYDDQLIPIVKNFFLRQQSTVFFNQSKLEAAIDTGHIYGLSITEPIQEIELELKYGRKEDVLSLAEILKTHFDLKPSMQSKFSRGLKIKNCI
ncbi:CYTH domain-containing protein [Pectinatus haikarae]|uniref:Triphosphatase n=1 Tax=Pectinatus haikarae TaxID=349096 RepID=A0ABT9Y6M1_9FIRM|nr:CYTH domain-containing protein [Pectinatus haikarae]MDQ0203470.1 triphosphatase [Pectinatus haikarae]